MNRRAKYLVLSAFVEYCFLAFRISATPLRFMMETLKDMATFFTLFPIIQLGDNAVGI
jgi:hypothetical protein